MSRDRKEFTRLIEGGAFDESVNESLEDLDILKFLGGVSQATSDQIAAATGIDYNEVVQVCGKLLRQGRIYNTGRLGYATTRSSSMPSHIGR
jgi:hypothetical protein